MTPAENAIAFGLPFEEAVAFFRQKGLSISPNALRELGEFANARSFTVAGVIDLDVLADIKAMVEAHLEIGGTFRQFLNDLRPGLEDRGWFAPKGERAQITLPDGTVRKRLTGARLETIYRNNIQGAYGFGRWKQMEAVPGRPYYQYHAVAGPLGDGRNREKHLALHGKIYHRLHPIWAHHWPPWEHN